MLIRLEWKENRSPAWRASSAGTSVSTVMLELGTTSPMRWGVTGFLLRLRRGGRGGGGGGGGGGWARDGGAGSDQPDAVGGHGFPPAAAAGVPGVVAGWLAASSAAISAAMPA